MGGHVAARAGVSVEGRRAGALSGRVRRALGRAAVMSRPTAVSARRCARPRFRCRPRDALGACPTSSPQPRRDLHPATGLLLRYVPPLGKGAKSCRTLRSGAGGASPNERIPRAMAHTTDTPKLHTWIHLRAEVACSLRCAGFPPPRQAFGSPPMPPEPRPHRLKLTRGRFSTTGVLTAALARKRNRWTPAPLRCLHARPHQPCDVRR